MGPRVPGIVSMDPVILHRGLRLGRRKSRPFVLTNDLSCGGEGDGKGV